MPRPPAPPSPERYLHAWRANDPAWLIHGGWDTLGFLNLKLRESFSGYALDMSGAGPALLALPVKAADGRPTLSLNTGTLRFYVAPDWSSVGLGGGPGGEARLIEFGAWSAQGQQTLCWLGVDGLGSTIRLVVNGATGPVEILAAPIQWAAGEWHQVALTWASGAPTMLYLDGRLAIAAGVGLDLSALESRYIGTGTPGFCVGSDGQGNRLAQGQFEEVYTFSRACTAEELAWNWQVQAKLAARGPISEEEAKALLESVAQLRSMPQPEPDGMSLAGLLWGGLPCLLWLEIDWSPATPGDVIVTLHNTIPGETYKLFSKTDLNLADWTLEETLPGAGGQNWTQTLRPIGQNPARFFTAEGPAEDLPDTSFPGLTLEDTGRDPPDTMGAVGPNHFVELLNGMIAVYNKTGQLVAGPEDTTHFFRVAGMNFPTGEYMVDPRVVYDQQSNRWVACAADLKFGGTYDVGLAVSTDSDPKPLLDENKWKKYHLDFYTGTGAAPDFPTLGVDANGIYICANYRGEFRNQVVAIDKAKLYGDPPELVTNIFDIPSSNHWRVIQPAVNFDPTPLGNLVWLIAKGPPQTSGNYQGGALLYRRLQWSNGSVDWKQEDRTDWHEVPEDPTLYRDYFDLDGADIGAPQKGGWTKIELGPAGYAVGSRLTMAVIRDQDLWTCHTIGLDGMDGDYSGNATGSTVDRSAVQWFRLHITTDGDLELQSVDDRGRIWDRRPSQPTHPSRVGGYDTSGSAYGVEVTSTSYAYVADGETGLQIINVYDPANPVRLGGYDTSGFAYDVAVFGYAYVADGDAGVQVINGYSDPSQPSRVGGYDTSGSARGLRVLGAYTY